MSLKARPETYEDFLHWWKIRSEMALELYARGEGSFIIWLLPEIALQLDGATVLDLLRRRFGPAIDLALHPDHTDPDAPPPEIPAQLRSPAAVIGESSWIKQANIVGINVRTVGSFWNIVKYALTLPAAQDAIHILPIWEPGVVGSIYGMTSWRINDEFFSPELAALVPTLDTTGRQLRAVVNLLHVMGRTVGMDVIPHADRFAEIVLAYPGHFEWLRRQDGRIITHAAQLHEAVEAAILAFVKQHGVAIGTPPHTREALFGPDIDEEQRLQVLFGAARAERLARRIALIKHLHTHGYETVPATMAPPYRGLDVDPASLISDEHGMVWRDYQITEPQPMSRVFGPLTRYKLYEPLDDNAGWEIDFARPRLEVWRYVCEHYGREQRRYGFDFMRGDMAHVQMRPDGVPLALDEHYDVLGAVKRYIQEENAAPWFASFAETFLAPRDVMAYGEELDHLEAAEADATLGDLQSSIVGSPEYLQRLRLYDDLAATRLCAPSLTAMTADKDDPRFDHFYHHGSVARLFLGLFLTDRPSYMGLGFETRDVHLEPAPNEHYTKLYVFQESQGPKATAGPYVWGRNGALFAQLTKLRLLADQLWPEIEGRLTRWLIAPDPTGASGVIAWTQRGPQPSYIFLVNTDHRRPAERFALPLFGSTAALTCILTTAAQLPPEDAELRSNGKHYKLTALAAEEARVYVPSPGATRHPLH